MKNSKLNKIINNTVYLFLILILFSGCADVTLIEKCVTDNPYNFWGGLWHGFIIPISFIGSLFDDGIAIYAINNNGGWYDFGFMLGTGLLFGGSSKIK